MLAIEYGRVLKSIAPESSNCTKSVEIISLVLYRVGDVLLTCMLSTSTSLPFFITKWVFVMSAVRLWILGNMLAKSKPLMVIFLFPLLPSFGTYI